MRYLLLLLLTACAPIENYDRSHDGCESYCYWCVGYYQHCGDKDVDVETTRLRLKND